MSLGVKCAGGALRERREALSSGHDLFPLISRGVSSFIVLGCSVDTVVVDLIHSTRVVRVQRGTRLRSRAGTHS